MEDLEKLAKAYALKNALTYSGKAQIGSVISALFNEGLKKRDVGKISKKISKIIEEVNSLNIKEQEIEFKKLKNIISGREGREGLQELPNSGKGVIMRFAPSASGPLHIGHAMTSSISFLYVKKYGGKFYVRIEDTNPNNIYPMAYKMIKSESKWLFPGNFLEIVIQSDRMKLYYKYSEELIKKNATYVCTCTQEEFEKYVKEKKDCPCRNLGIEENLDRWRKMLNKTSKGFSQGEAVLRFKSLEGMQSKNPAFRDFPLARINLTHHPLQKNKYKVWPLMNLAVAVDDIDMKITHVIRAKDHIDNSKKQEMIFKALNLEKKIPWTGFLGRFKFKDLDLSTTKFRQGIDKGEFKGWNDPKLPTIESLKSQGYKPYAFWKFAERIGLSESDKVIDRKEFFDLLNSFNRKKNL